MGHSAQGDFVTVQIYCDRSDQNSPLNIPFVSWIVAFHLCIDVLGDFGW